MSVTTETLRIVNEVVYKGKGESTKLKSDMQTTEKEVTKTGVSFDKMATAAGVAAAAFGVVAVGAKQFYDQLKAGAEVQAASFTFDNLTASIGSTSDAMIGDLQTATKGMISDLDLMRFASQTVAMGLGSTNEEVSALAELGSTLGAAFRGDAVAGMEEFNLLLANQSIPRLDSFGISAGAVRTRIAELQEQFPDMTREAAFTQAVLEQGQETMARLGDNSETAAAQLNELDATFKNIKDSAQENLAEGAVPVLVELNDLIGQITGGDASRRDPADFWNGFFLVPQVGFRALSNTITDVRELMDDFSAGGAIELFFAGGPLVQGIKALDEVTGELGAEGSGGYAKLRRQTEELTEETERLTMAELANLGLIPGWRTRTDEMADSHDQLEPAVRDTTQAVEDNTDALAEAEEAARLHAEALAMQEQAARDAGAALGDLFGQNVTVVENSDALALSLFESADAAGANAAQLGGLGVALGLFDEDAAESALKAALLQAAIDEIGRAFAEGEISVYEARDAYLAAQEEIGNLDFSIDTATGSMREDFIPATDEVKSAFEQATGAVNATIDSIDRIPREVNVDVNVNVHQNGSIPENVPGQGPSITSATGNVFPHGGMSLVGEFGPEFVRLPAGAQVISTNRTANTVNNTTFNGTTRRGERVLLDYLRRSSRPATITG